MRLDVMLTSGLLLERNFTDLVDGQGNTLSGYLSFSSPPLIERANQWLREALKDRHGALTVMDDDTVPGHILLCNIGAVSLVVGEEELNELRRG